MNLLSPSSAAPQLRLFALQHHGHPVEFVWEWPQVAVKAGFDLILSGLQPADAQVLAQVRYCVLQRMGPERQPFWLLGNSSREVVCSVNGKLLAAGSQIRLDHGDEIELGLTRFVVSLTLSDAAPEVAQPVPERARVAQDHADFSLTDLDALADVSGLTEDERYGINRSDFSDLISFSPEENAVTQPAVPEPSATPWEPTLDEALAAGGVPTYAEKVSSLLEQFTAAAEQPTITQEPPDDLFDALHTRYLDKLRHPHRNDVDTAWQDLVHAGQSQQADPMQQWMHAAGAKHSLDDLLGQTQDIASVIRNLDPLGTSDVLTPEPFDSVMHLFAPEHLRAQAQDPLEQIVQKNLPGLTRREHHSLSLDSAMPFTGGEEPPRKTQ